jgi:hypothetical protein
MSRACRAVAIPILVLLLAVLAKSRIEAIAEPSRSHAEGNLILWHGRNATTN